jgi:hypothetical protein
MVARTSAANSPRHAIRSATHETKSGFSAE